MVHDSPDPYLKLGVFYRSYVGSFMSSIIIAVMVSPICHQHIQTHPGVDTMPFPLDWEHVADLLLLDVDCFASPYSHLQFMHLEGGSGGGGDCGDIIGGRWRG
jgi:hypothetical protein